MNSLWGRQAGIGGEPERRLRGRRLLNRTIADNLKQSYYALMGRHGILRAHGNASAIHFRVCEFYYQASHQERKLRILLFNVESEEIRFAFSGRVAGPGRHSHTGCFLSLHRRRNYRALRQVMKFFTPCI